MEDSVAKEVLNEVRKLTEEDSSIAVSSSERRR